MVEIIALLVGLAISIGALYVGTEYDRLKGDVKPRHEKRL